MPTVDIINQSGGKAGQIELSDGVFGAKVSPAAIHQVVVAQLANKRQGTQSTLTRAEVRGGGIKPWRQKGSGRARHGSIRSPQWTKGGIVFAPKPRSYRQKINKKMRQMAIKGVLTQKVIDGELIVLENLVLDAPKTQDMVKVLSDIDAQRKPLIVTMDVNENVVKASRNIDGVKTTFAGSLNVYDMINSNKLVMTVDAVKKLEEVYA